MRIRPARIGELSLLLEIEYAAGRVFHDLDMAEIAENDLPTPAELTPYQQDGRAWVTADQTDRPIAYVLVEEVDGNLHVEQISVHPEHARRGLGRRLLEHLAGEAARRGMPALTLTTFVEVPWNAPYYERCGFRILTDDELTPGLRAIRDRETALGLDRWPRTAMRRDLLR
ncbi:GNAT family N-acetyltransferase [Micromonospora sp. NPDC050417]|uniref:GNAT family N-acetyltransferase n=1 Tax=Micromonospora sp. NPDC050417 TaxID=3364280 RepID=UPI00378AD6B4